MTDPVQRSQPESRVRYSHFSSLATRWMDNDIYGHVNNVVYYSLFDTAVNRYLIDRGVLDIHQGAVIGLVVETQCHYFAPIAFPDTVVAGLRVGQIGSSSVRYEIGLFRGDEQETAARGHFVHVYVDRQTRRPAPHTPSFLAALQPLVSQALAGKLQRTKSEFTI